MRRLDGAATNAVALGNTNAVRQISAAAPKHWPAKSNAGVQMKKGGGHASGLCFRVARTAKPILKGSRVFGIQERAKESSVALSDDSHEESSLSPQAPTTPGLAKKFQVSDAQRT